MSFKENLSLFCRYRPDLKEKIERAESGVSLSSEAEEAKQAQACWKRLRGHLISTVVVYGVGLGQIADAALPWLNNPFNRLILLEDDLSALKRFFEAERAESLLRHPQILVEHFEQVEGEREHFLKLLKSVHPAGKKPFKMLFAALSDQQKERRERFSALQRMLFSCFETLQRADEDYGFDLLIETNCYKNLLNGCSSFSFKGLEGKCKGLPAIICGAGPSLDLALGELRGLERRALIFAGGTAINLLNSQGILPHLASGIDPNLIHFAKIAMQSSYEVPFIYSARLHHEALQLLHGPKVYLPSKRGLSGWFDGKLGRSCLERIPGNSITTLNFYLAYLMGCNPLILVGTDMAFTGGRLYGEGLVGHPLIENLSSCRRPRPKRYRLLESEETETTYQFYLESRFFAKLPQADPDVKVINATASGLPIGGVEELPLQEAVEIFCRNEFDLRALIHREIASSDRPEGGRERVAELLESWSRELEEASLQLDLLLEEPIQALDEEASSTWQEFRKRDCYRFYLKQFDLALKELLQYRLFYWDQKASESEALLEVRRKEHFFERLASLKKRLENNLRLIEELSREKVVEEPSVNSFGGEAPLTELDARSYAFFYPSGVLYARGGKLHGKFEGEQLFFYEDGTLKSSLGYKRGVLNGSVKLFYPSGRLKRELVFRRGKREGFERLWGGEGELLMEIFYREDKPVGTARSWFPEGVQRLEIGFGEKGEIRFLKEWNREGREIRCLGLSEEVEEEVRLLKQVEEEASVLEEEMDLLLERLSAFDKRISGQLDE